MTISGGKRSANGAIPQICESSSSHLSGLWSSEKRPSCQNFRSTHRLVSQGLVQSHKARDPWKNCQQHLFGAQKMPKLVLSTLSQLAGSTSKFW
eukprot:s528_g43.t1